jgi:hypothetical protein
VNPEADQKPRLDAESEEDDEIWTQHEFDSEDRMSIYHEHTTETRPILSTEHAADANTVAELRSLIKVLSVQMGGMQSQIEAIMTGRSVEQITLSQDEAVNLPVEAFSGRASYHRQTTKTLAIRVSRFNPCVDPMLTLLTAGSAIFCSRTAWNCQ